VRTWPGTAKPSVILSVVLYECKTWSVRLREEQTEADSGMLKGIFEARRESFSHPVFLDLPNGIF
jgi:hypothetical protein